MCWVLALRHARCRRLVGRRLQSGGPPSTKLLLRPSIPFPSLRIGFREGLPHRLKHQQQALTATSHNVSYVN
jgi:hypothetical protein